MASVGPIEAQVIALAKGGNETTMERARYIEKLKSPEKGAIDPSQLRRRGFFVDAFSSDKDGLTQDGSASGLLFSHAEVAADHGDLDPRGRADSLINVDAQLVEVKKAAEDLVWGDWGNNTIACANVASVVVVEIRCSDLSAQSLSL